MAYKNKAQIKIKDKEWRDKNPEKVIAYREAHREERREDSKKRHWANREEQNEWAREYRRRNKLTVITHYSNGTCKCIHCAYSDIRALQIDHIKGGGDAHRREIKQDFYVWLIKNKFPDGFQVLCANCQQIKKYERKEWANKWTKREEK